MTCGISIVDKTLNKSFAKLGSFIGNHPGYFVIIPVLLTFLCATGYQQIQYEIDPEYLFSPIRGDGKTERAIIENFFEVNYTHRFNVGRITRPGRFGRVIVTTKDRTDDNMISREVFQELRMLDQLIQNTTAYYDGEAFTYTDICARWEDDCFQNDILNLDYIMDEILDGTLNVTFPVMFNPKTWDAHAFPVFFGGTRLSDSQTIVSVPAIQMVYFVTANTKRQDAKGAAWEEAFLEAVGIAEDQQRAFKFISIARFASRTLDHELERNTRTVVPYFASTFILMAGFSIITCMMGDSVRSKPWLGFFGNISALMATVAAFGFAMYLGIEFIGINLAAPFLMIGIGIDDTFVMLAAWRRTSCKLSVPERMSITLSEAAVSITITSLTDMVSFWIGIFSPFPSVQIFCAYSGFAVCFTFVWHITFFAGCMAISGYCEERNLHSIFGFKVQPMSVAVKENRSWLYRKFITGGINRSDPDNPLDNKEHMLMGFFRTHVADFINNRCVKLMILIIFGLYLMGAGYGVTKIKEGLERRKLSKADSYSVRFFDLEDEYYREFPYRIQVVITSNGDQFQYSNETIQEQIEMLVEQFENTSYVTSSLYTESWLRSFLSFYDRNEMYFNETINTETDFIRFLKENWLFPSNPYSLDVKFNENNTRILASRFLIQAVNITDTNHEKEMVKDLRQICLDSPLNVSVFHPYFVFFDQFELVRPTSIQNMIVGGIVMMIIAFIFIPNLLCSLWVAFSILSIELGVVGYMSLWSVNLDSISMINLIMCIGFSVDFTAHICYTYMSSKARLPADRVREALYSLGMPIVQGSISTILGCMGLLLADSYIFLVFFKMIFLVIFFGALHGLFLLPVLLSLFGPGSCCSSVGRSNGKDIDYDHDDIIDMYKRHNGTNKGLGGGILTNNYTIPHPQLKTISNSIVYGGASNNNNNNKSFHQMLSSTNNGNNGNILSTKPNSLSPYHKAYILNGNGGIIDEKDLGIGTSGEDSSESSSHNSQQQQQLRRLQAIEDANTLRRYEEGWRKTSNDNSLIINDPIRSISRMYQTDDGHDERKRSNGDSGGGGGAGGSGERILPIQKLSNNSNNKYKMNDNHLWMENDNDLLYRSLNNNTNNNSSNNQSTPIANNYLNKQSPIRRKSDENYHRKYYPDDFHANYYNTENNNPYNDEEDIIELDAFNQIHNQNQNNTNNVNSKRNIYDKRRRFSDEKRTRKYTPPELLNGIYQQNPNRSSSQHNLYYPRQLPFESSSSTSPHQQQQASNPSYRQRSSSQTSLHKLKHMGDIRFP